MHKLFRLLIVLPAVALIMTACNSNAGSDPKTTLKAFFEKLSKKDFDGASKLATKESQFVLSSMKTGLEMLEKMQNQAPNESGDPIAFAQDVEYGEARLIGEENALVPIKNKSQPISFDFPLKKEDGIWKVDCSPSTMMRMGRDAAGNNEYTDDEIPSVEQMQKSIEMADSLLKKIDPQHVEALKKAMEQSKQQ